MYLLFFFFSIFKLQYCLVHTHKCLTSTTNLFTIILAIIIFNSQLLHPAWKMKLILAHLFLLQCRCQFAHTFNDMYGIIWKDLVWGNTEESEGLITCSLLIFLWLHGILVIPSYLSKCGEISMKFLSLLLV